MILRSKRGELTFYEIMITGVFSMIFFFAYFGFYQDMNLNSAYPISNNSLFLNASFTNQVSSLQNSSETIRQSAIQIGESRTVIGFVISTIEGFTNSIKIVMKEAINMLTNHINIWLIIGYVPIPAWFIALLFIALTIVVIFIFYRAITGRIRI